MNINTDFERLTSRGDAGVISQSKPNSEKVDGTGRYALDISDIVMDDSAYKGQGKTVEGVMQDAQNLDLAVQRNYMTVMSNSMSTEDFQKLREEGFPVGTTDVEKIVTVVDQIKAKLVEAGIQIEGFTDSLSSKDLKNIVGSESRARAIASKLNEKDLPATEENLEEVSDALEETLKLTKMTENTKKYMIENRKEPTIENIYKAQFSSSDQQTRQGKGYYKDSDIGHFAKKADTIQWDQLESQIDKVGEEANLTDKEIVKREAKWLIENGIPLTKENLKVSYNLSQMQLPEDSNEIVDAIINAMVSGKKAKQTNLLDQRDVIKEAITIKGNINQITTKGIRKVIEENKPVTIENLIIASRLLDAESNNNEKDALDGNSNHENKIFRLNKQISSQENTTLEKITANQNNAQGIIRNQTNYSTNTSNQQNNRNEAIVSNQNNNVSNAVNDQNKSQATIVMDQNYNTTTTVKEQNNNLDTRETNLTNNSINSLYNQSSNPESQMKELTARRQVEEIRLQMSVEANIKLLKKGFSINTVELEKVIEGLKAVESETKKILYGNDPNSTILEKENLFQETKEKVAQIAELPATVIGKIIAFGKPTLNEIHHQGKLLERSYKDASQTYEALMTKPRRDLGDSIKGAFRNIDDILDDMDLEIGESNQRAVRILSYNNMVITDENVNAVKEADLALQQTIEKLTPARTLQLIREGINPLEISLKDLEEQLDTIKIAEENPAEKYSKFLQKLEQHNEISPEEKEAYIGIHRLLRQVEKGDGAAIGSLINQGNELSFKNLLVAVRSKKKEGMDYQIDEKFAGVEATKDRGNKISDQITNYYNRLATKLADNVVRNLESNESQTDHYVAEDKEKVQEMQKVEDYVIQSLLDTNLPVTLDNLLATKSFSNDRDSIFKKMKKAATEENLLDSFMDASDNISENFSSKEEIDKAYEGLQENMNKIIDSAIEKGNKSIIDMKEMSMLYKQISFATRKVKEENYEVPITVNGETTAINLRIIHGKEDVGKVVATMKTEEYGQVAAEFGLNKGKVKGYIAGDSEKGFEALKGIQEFFEANLMKEGHQVEEIQVITSQTLNIQTFMQKNSNGGSKVSTKELYQVAKAFIVALQENGLAERTVEKDGVR